MLKRFWWLGSLFPMAGVATWWQCRRDPEFSHILATRILAFFPLRQQIDDPALSLEVFGRTFPNPIGIAAGFDKNGQCIDGLLSLGFGYVEIGTLTPKPQFGNAKPRVFRLTEDRAIINRYGFNNPGLDIVRERLLRRKNSGILGVNLGPNRDSIDPVADYVFGVQMMADQADYLVINVSSPNTPGLRNWQKKEELVKIIDAVQSSTAKRPTLLLKISPDLTEEEEIAIAEVALMKKLDGLIIANTTISRPETLKSTHRSEKGGLSGPPLSQRSLDMLDRIYQLTEGKIPLISVGGISNGKDVYQRIRKGASLVQIYTAFAYEGPRLIPQMKRELLDLLKQDGFTHLSAAIGADQIKMH